jgi:transmembrane sensor
LTFASRSNAQIDEPRIEVVTAWRRGEVVLDGTPLSEAISEMNRYDRTRLVVPDPKVAALPVSGIYQAGSSETFAIMVARLYGLEVTHEYGQISLTDPNPASSK